MDINKTDLQTDGGRGVGRLMHPILDDALNQFFKLTRIHGYLAKIDEKLDILAETDPSILPPEKTEASPDAADASKKN